MSKFATVSRVIFPPLLKVVFPSVLTALGTLFYALNAEWFQAFCQVAA